jgi:[ribosomal protein S5]-alanine N-acetyltransferase
MTLQTARLILSPWQVSDWPEFRPIAQDPEVMRYITGGEPWPDEKIENFIARQGKLFSDRGFCRWKVTESATNTVIGFCGPGLWRDETDPEIGWWLARRYWGQGLATEAARAALADSFGRLKLERLISIAMPGNAASRRIMEKLGFTLEREFENGGIPLVQYALDRAAYLKSQPPA